MKIGTLSATYKAGNEMSGFRGHKNIKGRRGGSIKRDIGIFNPDPDKYNNWQLYNFAKWWRKNGSNYGRMPDKFADLAYTYLYKTFSTTTEMHAWAADTIEKYENRNKPKEAPDKPIVETGILKNFKVNKKKGAYSSYLADIKDDGRAIVKLDNEPNWEGDGWIPSSDLAKAETLAYKLDQMLGLDVVPPTALRNEDPDGDGIKELVSAQQWIEGTKTFADGSWEEIKKVNMKDVVNMSILDAIECNPDRHANNVIYDTNHRVYAIDNGIGFWFKRYKEADVSYNNTLDNYGHNKPISIPSPAVIEKMGYYVNHKDEFVAPFQEVGMTDEIADTTYNRLLSLHKYFLNMQH